MSYWQAFRYADSPRIREYLWNLILDVSSPSPVRSVAATTLFEKFEPDERLQEYLRAFETRNLPAEAAWAQTAILFERGDPERLLRGVGQRVRLNPTLAFQMAFTQIVETSPKYASKAARHKLGEDLQIVQDHRELTQVQTPDR